MTFQRKFARIVEVMPVKMLIAIFDSRADFEDESEWAQESIDWIEEACEVTLDEEEFDLFMNDVLMAFS